MKVTYHGGHLGKVSMPAGEYWIGDLCYVEEDDDFRDAHVDAVCNSPRKDGGLLNGKFEINGTFLVEYSTLYGDGSYRHEGMECTGQEYLGVDSGTIGIISLKDLFRKEHVTRNDLAKIGIIVSFKEDFKCWSDVNEGKGGDLHFGSLVVHTGDDDVDWEEEEEA